MTGEGDIEDSVMRNAYASVSHKNTRNTELSNGTSDNAKIIMIHNNGACLKKKLNNIITNILKHTIKDAMSIIKWIIHSNQVIVLLKFSVQA